MQSPPPPITGILETVIYTRDLARAKAFYEGMLGLPVVAGDGQRFHVFAVAPRQLLLVFLHGATSEPIPAPRGGTIPPHHSDGGAHHLGFAIDAADLDPWKAHLAAAGVPLLSEAGWTRGGRSLYFHDPDGHVLELITPGIWPNY